MPIPLHHHDNDDHHQNHHQQHKEKAPPARFVLGIVMLGPIVRPTEARFPLNVVLPPTIFVPSTSVPLLLLLLLRPRCLLERFPPLMTTGTLLLLLLLLLRPSPITRRALRGTLLLPSPLLTSYLMRGLRDRQRRRRPWMREPHRLATEPLVRAHVIDSLGGNGNGRGCAMLLRWSVVLR